MVVEVLRGKYVIHADLNNKKERMYSDAAIARMFTCPSARAATDAGDAYSRHDDSDPSDRRPNNWTSDYAMNSNCREGSPDDMVFLFESKPGWNQHGGPELFTFENHEPKGGCVLLNDGTVKFIRTEEELHALRWK